MPINYQSVLDRNIRRFNHGATFTREELNSMCGDTDSNRYTDVRGAVHYLQLNKLLRPLGLYIKSRNYYSNFEVLPIEATETRAISYTGEAVAKQRRSTTLSQGLQRYSSWDRMTVAERRAAARSNWRT